MSDNTLEKIPYDFGVNTIRDGETVDIPEDQTMVVNKLRIELGGKLEIGENAKLKVV